MSNQTRVLHTHGFIFLTDAFLSKKQPENTPEIVPVAGTLGSFGKQIYFLSQSVLEKLTHLRKIVGETRASCHMFYSRECLRVDLFE